MDERPSNPLTRHSEWRQLSKTPPKLFLIFLQIETTFRANTGIFALRIALHLIAG